MKIREATGDEIAAALEYGDTLYVVNLAAETKLPEGMSLRDYFAAKAMDIAYAGHAPEYLAEVAYQMADAMLAERAK